MIRMLLLSLCLLMPTWAIGEGSSLPSPQVTIKTAQGDIVVRLFRDRSPITVANFLSYVDSGHYNGTVFHRVIPGFMIQGGGFLPDMTEKETGEPIVNESKNKLHNLRGTIVMARTNDPDSATTQFFINQRTNLRLDWTPGNPGYTVFGEVTSGMSVVDYIASSPTTTAGRFQDIPMQPIIITEIKRKSLL